MNFATENVSARLAGGAWDGPGWGEGWRVTFQNLYSYIDFKEHKIRHK